MERATQTRPVRLVEDEHLPHGKRTHVTYCPHFQLSTTHRHDVAGHLMRASALGLALAVLVGLLEALLHNQWWAIALIPWIWLLMVVHVLLAPEKSRRRVLRAAPILALVVHALSQGYRPILLILLGTALVALGWLAWRIVDGWRQWRLSDHRASIQSKEQAKTAWKESFQLATGALGWIVGGATVACAAGMLFFESMRFILLLTLLGVVVIGGSFVLAGWLYWHPVALWLGYRQTDPHPQVFQHPHGIWGDRVAELWGALMGCALLIGLIVAPAFYRLTPARWWQDVSGAQDERDPDEPLTIEDFAAEDQRVAGGDHKSLDAYLEPFNKTPPEQKALVDKYRHLLGEESSGVELDELERLVLETVASEGGDGWQDDHAAQRQAEEAAYGRDLKRLRQLAQAQGVRPRAYPEHLSARTAAPFATALEGLLLGPRHWGVAFAMTGAILLSLLAGPVILLLFVSLVAQSLRDGEKTLEEHCGEISDWQAMVNQMLASPEESDQGYFIGIVVHEEGGRNC